MSGVFINYRRDDSAGYAGRLSDHLGAHFGHNKVFMDVTDIEPGLDFVEAIDAGIGACDALLVVMSTQWLTATAADGSRRIDDPADYLRLEITTALKRGVRIIPLLVRGAKMPGENDLPPELASLARKHAVELSDDRWDYDMRRLVEVLERLIGKPAPRPAPVSTANTKPAPKRRRWPWFVGGIGASFAAVVALGVALEEADMYEPPDPLPSSGFVGTAVPAAKATLPGVDSGLGDSLNIAPEPSAPQLSGTWYNDAGVRYEIAQQRGALVSQVFDIYGNLIATGAGDAGNHRVNIEYTYVIGGGGRLSGTVRDDEEHIDFSYSDYATGMTISGTLHLEHYAGQ
ncbi:MAG: toll/interleukin-1 receptor domain-containing protein [Pseudomonadota bacterium]